MHIRIQSLAAGAVVLAAIVTISAAPSAPAVSAPISGGERGQPFGALAAGERPNGYLEEERFFSGTATAYTKAAAWGVDGKWDVTPATTAPYQVRMLVRRPTDPAPSRGPGL